MKKTYNVLLIDDHPFVLDAYEMAFKEIERESSSLCFMIDKAFDFDSGLSKIKKATKRKDTYIIMLDIRLGKPSKGTAKSGEDLGMLIMQLLPTAKIIVSTFCNDAYIINSIFRNINPLGFIIKSDFNINELNKVVESILKNIPYYSTSINEHIRKTKKVSIELDDIDKKLIYELSIGTKKKDLPNFLPLSMAGIEKRRRRLKDIFKLENQSDRELILKAKEIGII